MVTNPNGEIETSGLESILLEVSSGDPRSFGRATIAIAVLFLEDRQQQGAGGIITIEASTPIEGSIEELRKETFFSERVPFHQELNRVHNGPPRKSRAGRRKRRPDPQVQGLKVVSGS